MAQTHHSTNDERRFTVRLPEPLYIRLHARRVRERKSMNNIIIEAVRLLLNGKPAEDANGGSARKVVNEIRKSSKGES